MPFGLRDAVIRERRVWLGTLVFLVVAGTTAAVVVWLAGGTTERATAEGECHLAGWVSGQGTITGTGAVPCDEPVKLTATAKAGWCFSFWPGDEPSLGCPRSSHKVVTVTAAEGSILWSAVFKLEPPFSIELSAPPICDVEQSEQWYGVVRSTDANGNDVYDNQLGNWFDPGEVEVVWTITGGTSPYTIAIDGETRDGDGTYEGATGTASASCALKRGEPSYWEYDYFGFTDPQPYARTYLTEPTVDSGYKLITASVTDADGLTAEAAIEVYAVFNGWPDDEILRAGKTYRIPGHRIDILVTAPHGLDIELGGYTHNDCDGPCDCTETVTFVARQHDVTGILWMCAEDRRPLSREYWRQIEGFTRSVRVEVNASDPQHTLDALFDDFVASVGIRPPRRSLEAD